MLKVTSLGAAFGKKAQFMDFVQNEVLLICTQLVVAYCVKSVEMPID
jgi:hypothetical protein